MENTSVIEKINALFDDEYNGIGLIIQIINNMPEEESSQVKEYLELVAKEYFGKNMLEVCDKIKNMSKKERIKIQKECVVADYDDTATIIKFACAKLDRDQQNMSM